MSTNWTTSNIHQFPIAEAEQGQHFTSGSRVASGLDDDAHEAGLRVNDLFIRQPELVIGQIGMVRKNTTLWQAVLPPAERSVAELLRLRLTEALAGVTLRARNDAPVAAVAHAEPKELSPRAKGMLAICEVARALLKADAGADTNAEALRHELNVLYDGYVREYGVIHARANQQALKGTPEIYFLRALETDVDTNGSTVTAAKTQLFYMPTVRPTPPVTIGSMEADEAYLRCLNDKGRIDLATIATYAGKREDEVISALQGRIYHDPALDAWVPADEYLSGDVVTKLEAARAASETNGAYLSNVISLEAVQPAPLSAGKIKARIGAPWISVADVRGFIMSIVPAFRYGGDVMYHAPIAKWTVRDRNGSARHSNEARMEWGTERMHALDLTEKALNGVPPVVYDKVGDGENERLVVNQKETLLAQEKWMRISARFSQWIWEDAGRAERLVARYNQTFNRTRRRDFDGSHLLLPGINRSILTDGDLLPHQKDGVWAALQRPASLWDLCVGAGKTYMGLVWAYEVKRLGIARKPLIVVPNNLVEQWGIEANRLYPDMKVLVMSPEDFTKGRRNEFLSRIVTEDFDMVICAHTSFGFIESVQAQHDFITLEVNKLRDYLHELSKGGDDKDKRSKKQIEERVKTLRTKLRELTHSLKRDRSVLSWEDLGIDALFVDECQEFKNLATATMMSVAGVPKGDSKRAFDMRVKTWDILRRGGRVVFATGTPIMNSVGEAFIMMTFLGEHYLRDRGIDMFDAWARTFAEVVPVFEMTPDGGGFQVKSRLARFVNLPELFAIWYEFTFSRSREQLGLPTPALMGGRRIGVTIPASSRLKKYTKYCVARVEAIKNGLVKPYEDNILCVISDASKAALDTRLVMGSGGSCISGMAVADIAIAEEMDADEELVACQEDLAA